MAIMETWVETRAPPGIVIPPWIIPIRCVEEATLTKAAIGITCGIHLDVGAVGSLLVLGNTRVVDDVA